MGGKRYQRNRRWVGFLVALVLPSIAIAWLGRQVIVQQRKLDREQVERDRQSAAAEIGAAVRDRLNRIKAQEIAAAAKAVDGYSDAAVALVASAEGGRLVLPWESTAARGPEAFHRASENLSQIEAEATRAVYQRRQPAQAAALLRAEMQKARDPIEYEYLNILLARTLKAWEGHRREAEQIYVDLLSLSSDLVDDSAIPQPLWRAYAADVLLDDGVRGNDILNRVEQDLESFSELARWNTTLREVLDRLRPSRDAQVARRAAADLDLLALRTKRLGVLTRLNGVQALQAAFPTLGVTPETWPVFPSGGAADLWLVGMGPQSRGRWLVVAVRAEEIRKSIESGRPVHSLGTPFRFAADGDTGMALGEGLPGLRAVFAAAVPGGSEGASNLQWFYVLSLGLIVAFTFFGGHLLWRDTRREARLAELRSQFVSSVSHELKTPLTAIRMVAETLQMRGVSDPELHTEYLETIVNESERLTRLLNNVLDFSRIERGEKTYHLQPAALDDVVRGAARTMRFPLAGQGFELRMELAGGVTAVRVDRDAIEQAVLNLLGNAMKYSGESRAIDLRLAAVGGCALIQVTDRGVGVPLAERKSIFERFYRVQSPLNRSISGAGLGLALVAHIAEAHGGSVEVESEIGKGSTFTLRIPIQPSDGEGFYADSGYEQAHAGDTQ